MSNLAPANVQTAIGLINKMRPQLERALAKPELAERFTRCVITEVGRNPKLATCIPESFATAVYESAQCHLEVGAAMGQAYLIPYGRDCTLVIGYRGLVDLAYRSGQVQDIYAENVYAKDAFRYVRGSSPRIEHEPALGGDRGEYIGTYAVAHTTTGGMVPTWVTKDDMDGIKKRSQSARRGSGPWVEHEDQMRLKTAVRRIIKILPASVMPTAVHSHLEQEDARDFKNAREAQIVVDNPAPSEDKAAPAPPAASAPSKGVDLAGMKKQIRALLKTLPPDVSDKILDKAGAIEGLDACNDETILRKAYQAAEEAAVIL